jgi:exodeoxyribonuclease VII small subunit
MGNENKSEFAQNWEELKAINDWFRQQDFDLEEGLEKLKLGEELVKKCQKRLKEIDNQFTEVEKSLGR